MRDLGWRVGRKVGRTIYAAYTDEPSDADVLIGLMDSRELAERAVYAHNTLLSLERLTQQVSRLDVPDE